MKIPNVKVANFLSIGEAEFSLDGLGLVHVSGVNNDETSADSNGSGKSSLGDAISWCLWGSTARGVTGDEVVNTAAGKGTSVILTLEDEDDTWRIERYRKAPKHKNGLLLFQHDAGTDEWIERTKGTTALTQRAIERLLGCSEEVFNAAVYSGQEMMPDIPRMTDRQLKLLVEQAAGVDVLANAYDVARGRYRERAEKRSQAQVTYDRATERHNEALASVTALNDTSSNWAGQQQTKVAALKQRTTDAVATFTKAKDDLDPTTEQTTKEAIAEVEGKIASVSGEQARERTLAGDITTSKDALSQLQRKIAMAEGAVRSTGVAVDRAKANLEEVGKGVGLPCNSCGRPLEKEHLAKAIERATDVVTRSVQEQEAAVADHGKIAAKVAGFEKAVTAAEEALAAHRATMTDVSAEGLRLRELQRELAVINATKNEVERLRVAAQNLGAEWKKEAAAGNPYTAMIAQADNKVLQCADHAEQAKAELLAATEEEKYAQAVVDVFAPAGVRAHRLDEATPYLNERTAHYLGSLADGAIDAYWTTLTEKKSGKGDLTEKFSVTVEKAGSAPSFNALSGGEKRKVRLACALALQDLVATRAAKNIELWIGDEIDDALDPAGLERLMGVLEEKARERGTVLVISHNDIAAYARKTILVEKTGGRATVTVQ